MVTAFEMFRAQYPQGCLVSDLITIQDGQYVVRAAVVNEGKTLATGLAASTDVQIAEDKARERAIALIGIATSAPEKTVTKPQPEEIATAQISQPTSAIAAPQNGSAATTSSEAPSTEAALPAEMDDDLGPPIDAIAESAEPVDESLEPTPAKVSAATIALENFNASAQPVDLSDVIAQTDVELTRLGWTNTQGIEYLKKTYGKRSRQQLTDEELMSFLLYLEEQ